MVDWFPDLRRQTTQNHKLFKKGGFPTFPFYLFHDSPNGEQPSVGDAEHADCVRITILPPRNFLHPDEIPQFTYPFCNCSKLY